MFDWLPSWGDVGDWLFGSEATPGTPPTLGTATTPPMPGTLPTPATQGNWLPVLQGLNTTIGAFSSPDEMPAGGFGATKEGFEATQQFNRDKLAQEMAIAQLQAQASGAGSGAALEAARIQARVNMAALREKAIADRLALKYQVVRGEPEMLAKGYEMMQRGSQQTGQAGLEGYNRAAQLLQGFRS